MPLPLLALNIVVWLLALAYLLRLVPALRRHWHPLLAVLALVTCGVVSFASYRVSRQQQVKQRFRQHYDAGIDEKQRGNLDAAERQFREALSVRPGDPEVQRQLQELKDQKTAERREQVKDTQVAPADPGSPPTTGAPAQQDRPGEKPKPASHTPSPFEITHYGLDVELQPKEHGLKALATIRVRSRGQRVPQLDFSLNPQFKPLLVQVDGAPAKWDHRNDLLAVTAPRPLEPGKEATVTVRYQRKKGPAILGDTLDLISEKACYLRTETRWYPATGELDFRAPVRVKATVPAGFTVVSVGGLKGKTKVGDRVTFRWETTRPAAMVSLAAAPYVQQSVSLPAQVGAGGRDALPITCYTFPGHKDRAAAFLKEAASIIRFYEKHFGPYPYEKLGVVEIPLFPGGYGTTSFVMLIDQSFAERKIDREFLAHEIAHQWWGNSVFPQGLGAAWLTEAFSNYSAWMYHAGVTGNPRVMQKRLREANNVYFRETARKGDQALLEADPYAPVGATQAILYEKGAVVLHMLRRQIGDRPFLRVLRAFADRFRMGKASIDDFRAVAQQESGQDLAWFFDQWLGRTGGMQVTYSFKTEADSPTQNQAVLTLRQPAPGYRAKMKVVLDVDRATETHQIEFGGTEQVVRLPVKGKVSTVLLDPDGDYLMRPPKWVVEP